MPRKPSRKLAPKHPSEAATSHPAKPSVKGHGPAPGPGREALPPSKRRPEKPLPLPKAGRPAPRHAAAVHGRRPTDSSAKALSGHPADHAQDEILAARLIEDLEFRHGIDVSTLDVSIRAGRGVARGVVSDADEMESVRETLEEEQAINDLECSILIAPTRREEDRDQARAIQEVLDAESDLASQDVQVACMNRTVVLRGTVSSELHKVKAGLMALRQDNVLRVRNRIVVAEQPPGARPRR